MDNKIRITIPVGESRYPMWIDPKEEPIFREAGRRVNERITAYSKQFHDSHLPSEDILAMAALDLAVQCQRLNQTACNEATEASVAAMVADLQDFLNHREPQS